MGVEKLIPAFFRHISASGVGSGGLATRFLAGLAAVELPYGLSVDIEPFRSRRRVKKTTSGRVYFRSGSERPPNAFFGRFGRRGLSIGDI